MMALMLLLLLLLLLLPLLSVLRLALQLALSDSMLLPANVILPFMTARIYRISTVVVLIRIMCVIIISLAADQSTSSLRR